MLSVDEQIKEQLAKKKFKADMASIVREKVLIHPSGSPERWRAAIKQLCVQRPAARDICNDTAAYAFEKRKSLHASNLFAASKGEDGSDIRSTMSVPPFFKQALTLIDPEYFLGKKNSYFSSAKHMHKMKIAFPEFVIPEKF